LTIGYFDQNRLPLNDDKTVFDNVSELSDTLVINNRKIHVISYLQDFLFSPSRTRTLVKNLSGGERNRVMLAKLFSKPCNVLVLDEPTNDLDFETLELLEEQLVQYSGTLLLVSHDRTFLNNVVTSILVIEENGMIGEYVGGYDDWLAQCPAKKILKISPEITPQPETDKKSNNKLSFNEQRELSLLPTTIESMEIEIASLQEKLNNPLFYKNHSDQVATIRKTHEELAIKLDLAYERWEELEKKLQRFPLNNKQWGN
jgi:ATP-binding cassette subfamily F protein uup